MLRGLEMETSGLIEIFEKHIRTAIKHDVQGKCNLVCLLFCVVTDSSVPYFNGPSVTSHNVI